ncbi:alpha-ketoglutarate-dependent dioxygenase AlkB [Nonomuraea sp. NPDC050540]|uniref:alpha-ketoglutarate-dependent dioxygenase AlkB n=1 Tax=Nonomuraea sp. NPDC050540 TaxID=3364367 RepID=UPI00379545CF
MSDSFDQLFLVPGDGVAEQPSDSVPGLRYIPDWLAPPACESLLLIIDATSWSTQLRRRVQHYGHHYDYVRRGMARNSASATAPALPSWAGELAARLVREGIMDQEADQVIVNDYQPGQGISPHVDCVPCFGPVVAAVSLGSPCLMDFTHSAEKKKVSVGLAPGSLCVMTGPARYAWRHSIAARKSDPGPTGRVARGRRVSVTFRTVISPPI